MEIKNLKIMVGKEVIENHGTLQLQQLKGNNFSYQLPLKSNDPFLADQNHLAGKHIYIWITSIDGQKNFLIGMVRQITTVRHSYDSGEIILSGEVKKLIYVLSLLTNYRLTLTLAIVIPFVFLSVLTSLFIDQKHNLVEKTGTVTAFSKRSGGARSPSKYKFQLQEFKAHFERPYEGLIRFTALNIEDEIYTKPSQDYPYNLKQVLKPEDQRKFSWYMENHDLHKLNTAGVTLPYVYLHAVNEKSDALFLHDLYNYVFDKYNIMDYLFLSYFSTTAFLMVGVAIKRGKNLFWKVYYGFILITFFILFII
ncbi:hypothetical protein [Pedobacter sp. D749]|uniref:hypothetical protein n=1 Tax=Pedobacter sp. D749 TaxID=2856523 RepID=UPI001C56D41C|nr:hypothetical protein [Pedobacter sp. D749]QXU44157.1 hypothetical protein KYH19_11405 [Pedobacter sp. D749]